MPWEEHSRQREILRFKAVREEKRREVAEFWIFWIRCDFFKKQALKKDSKVSSLNYQKAVCSLHWKKKDKAKQLTGGKIKNLPSDTESLTWG